MSVKPVRPRDVLSDEENTTVLSGRTVRKGTVAAVLANITIFESDESTAEEKSAAKNMIIELAPNVIAVGLNNHVTWNNQEIQTIFDRAESSST